MRGFDQHNPHHAFDLLTHTARAVGATRPYFPLRLAALLHDVGKPDCLTLDEHGTGHFFGHEERSAQMAQEILKRLKADRATTQTVLPLVRNHMLLPVSEGRALRRRAARFGPAGYALLLELGYADNIALGTAEAERLAAFRNALDATAALARTGSACLSLHELAVGGRDLLQLGFKPDAALGNALRRLLELVLDGKAENEREALLEAARRMLPEA